LVIWVFNNRIMKLSEIKNILETKGIYLTKLRGQNFLLDENILNSIVKTANISKEDTIVEIGTGFGFLTAYLLETGAKVISFEIDKKVYEIAGDLLKNFHNLKLIHQDFMRSDITQLCDGVFRVVANIPYNIASQILIKLWYNKEKVSDIYLLVQKEFGQRIVSKTAGKEIGFLSILLQSDYEIEIIKKVSPHCFYPAPKVESVYLKFTPQESSIDASKREKYFQFLKSSFSERRKKLLPKIKKMYANALEIIQKCGIKENVRAEELKVHEWITIFNNLEESL